MKAEERGKQIFEHGVYKNCNGLSEGEKFKVSAYITIKYLTTDSLEILCMFMYT